MGNRFLFGGNRNGQPNAGPLRSRRSEDNAPSSSGEDSEFDGAAVANGKRGSKQAAANPKSSPKGKGKKAAAPAAANGVQSPKQQQQRQGKGKQAAGKADGSSPRADNKKRKVGYGVG